MEKTFNPTYEIYYRQCLDGIMHHLSLNRLSAILALDEYEATHGEAYIIAMAGFINYAQTEQLDDFAVQSTLVHDLNGRKDKLMLPRTSDYAQYANTFFIIK